MQACILISSAVYILANLVADLLYAYFDPRIRYGTVAD
jgi:peptide/nickel transport system permease protein